MGILFFMMGGFMTTMTLIADNMWITGGFAIFTLYATICGFKEDLVKNNSKRKD